MDWADQWVLNWSDPEIIHDVVFLEGALLEGIWLRSLSYAACLFRRVGTPVFLLTYPRIVEKESTLESGVAFRVRRWVGRCWMGGMIAAGGRAARRSYKNTSSAARLR